MRLPDVLEWAANAAMALPLPTGGSPGSEIEARRRRDRTCAAEVTLCDSQLAFKLQAQHFGCRKSDLDHISMP